MNTNITPQLKRVAFIGNYLPRKCGIATFTSDLAEAFSEQFPEIQTMTLAMNDTEEGYAYPSQVRYEISQDERFDYEHAAYFLNQQAVDIVSLQHEYGIYGGLAGSHILTLLRNVTTGAVTFLSRVTAGWVRWAEAVVEPTLDWRRLLHAQVPAQQHKLIFGNALGHGFHRCKLQRLAQEGAFADFLHRKAGHEGAGLRHHVHQPLARQPCHSLGHGRARNAKRLADLWLAQHLAGPIGQRQDGGLQGQIDPMRQRAVEFLQRPKTRRRRVCLLQGRVFTG